MSNETLTWLNRYTLIGKAAERGKAWHYAANEQHPDAPNHFDGFIPIDTVRERLFRWQARFQPVYRKDITLDGVTDSEVPGHRFVIGGPDDDVLNIVSGRYAIHQYDDALLDNVAALLDTAAGDLGIVSAGLLEKGGTGWVQIEPPQGVTVAGTTVYPFFNAVSSHSGRYSTTYRFGQRAVVCDNTLAMMMGEAMPVHRVKHTTNSLLRVADAREVLGVMFESASALQREIERLLNWTVSDAAFEAIIAKVYPHPARAVDGEEPTQAKVTRWENRVAELDRLYRDDPRVAPWTGTAWGVYQAFNTYDNHYRPVRGGDRAEKNMFRFLDGDTLRDDQRVLAAIRTTT